MVKNASQNASPPGLLLARMECLADLARLRILRLLERHELGVVEVCDILQSPQSTVSRHLKLLLDQGWVKTRRQSTNHWYRMILDELDEQARRLWILARDQSEGWATFKQDQLRLESCLARRQTDSRAFFAGAAAEWDRLRTDLYGHSFTLQAILPLLPADHVVADLGCGSGHLAGLLAPHVKSVIAVDESAAMLKAARKHVGPNVDLRRGDILKLPIDSLACHAAFLVLVLSYIPDPSSAIAEAARIIRPGGKLVLVDLLPHDRDDFRRRLGQHHLGLSLERVGQMCRAAGLSDVDCRPIPPESGAKGPALFIGVAKAPLSQSNKV
jgi:ubiquinone/menaquinone biosynthesis C-methylase UbiE/DNA-binding MarR family transcriptional regulator